LADAFDLGGVPVTVDFAVDVAQQPAEANAQELDGSIGALELVGMGVAPDHDGGPLGHPEIALPQPEAVLSCEGGHLHDRLVGEPGIGGVGNRLGLNGGVDRHPLLAESLAPPCQRGPVDA